MKLGSSCSFFYGRWKPGPGEDRDFRDWPVHRQKNKQQLMERAARPGAQQVKGLPAVEYPNPKQRPELKKHYFGLLRSSALGKPHESESRDALLAALNCPVMGLNYSPSSGHTYRIFGSEERISAESLLQYLNLVA
jgi:hypothetical protein